MQGRNRIAEALAQIERRRLARSADLTARDVEALNRMAEATRRLVLMMTILSAGSTPFETDSE